MKKQYIRKNKKKQKETKRNKKWEKFYVTHWGMDRSTVKRLKEAVKWFLVCVSVVEQNIEQLSFGWGMFRILEVRNVDYNAR
jgi:hypothetical protein